MTSQLAVGSGGPPKRIHRVDFFRKHVLAALTHVVEYMSDGCFVCPTPFESAAMARLDAEQIALAGHLHDCIVSADGVAKRLRELFEDSKLEDRQVVRFGKFPRINIRDVSENADLVHNLIHFSGKFGESSLREALVMQYAFSLVDKDYDWHVSAQNLVRLRDEHARFEGDKVRLLWAYFIRQIKRSEFSHEVPIWRLKQEYLHSMAATRASPISASQAPAVADAEGRCAKSMDLILDALPTFPIDCNDEHDHDIQMVSVVPLLAISSDEEERTANLPPLPPPLASPPSTPLHGVAAQHARQACLTPSPVPETDGWFPIPKSFTDTPLPVSLEVGLPSRGIACKRSLQATCGPNLDEILADLHDEAAQEYCAHAHARNVRNMAKRPAGPPPAVGKAKPAAGKRFRISTKRPRNSPPLQPHEPAHVPESAHAPAHAPETAHAPTHAPESALPSIDAKAIEDSLRLCRQVACTDHPRTDVASSPGRLRSSVQRGIYLVQVLCGPQAVCMVSCNQFGSVEVANAAAEILLTLWNAGATKSDMQRCKVLGCIFGRKCGIMRKSE